MRQVKRKTRRKQKKRKTSGFSLKRFCYQHIVAPPLSWLERQRDRVRDLFSFRHPVFLLSLTLVFCLAVVILLLSGVIGRTIDHTETVLARKMVQTGFGVAEVKITGLNHTSPAIARAALGIHRGTPTFFVDLYRARARLMALPWVKDVVVHRRYPGFITVAVTEKQPFALWQTPQAVYIIEKSGAIITDRNVSAFTYLPVLLGDGAPKQAANVVDAVRKHPQVASKVALYQYQSERRWNLIMTGGVKVKLPEFGWKKELGTLQKLIVGQKILKRDLNEIDLRSKSFLYFGGVPGTTSGDTNTQEGRAI